MSNMIPFEYVEFYDVPRCIVLRYKGKLFLIQSAFDESLDDYPSDYSVYLLPESVEDSLKKGSWEFIRSSPMTCIGSVQVAEVVFDSSKRKELDASFLDKLMAEQEPRTN